MKEVSWLKITSYLPWPKICDFFSRLGRYKYEFVPEPDVLPFLQQFAADSQMLIYEDFAPKDSDLRKK